MSFVQGLNIFGSQRYLPFLELVPIRWIALSALARSNCEVDLLKTLVASSYMQERVTVCAADVPSFRRKKLIAHGLAAFSRRSEYELR